MKGITITTKTISINFQEKSLLAFLGLKEYEFDIIVNIAIYLNSTNPVTIEPFLSIE